MGNMHKTEHQDEVILNKIRKLEEKLIAQNTDAAIVNAVNILKENSPELLREGAQLRERNNCLLYTSNTFNRLWGVTTPAQAMAEIERQRAAAGSAAPKNLEQQAISLVGTDRCV